MPGYIFIKANTITRNPYALETNRFFEQIVSIYHNKKEKKIKFVTDYYINSLRAKLKSMMSTDLEIGQEVKITNYLFKY